MEIFRTQSGTLEYLESEDILILKGKHFSSDEDIKNMMDAVLTFCKQRQIQDILFDLSEWEGLRSEGMIDFLIYEQGPKFLLADICTHAIIAPTNELASLTMQYMANELHNVLKIEFFDDINAAKKWIIMERAKRNFPFSKN